MYWIAFGDVHERAERAASIPDLAGARAVILSGDITNRGGAAAARRVLDSFSNVNGRILGQLGNMDTDAVHAFFKDQGMNIHLEARELAPGLGLMGVGCSTPTPFGTPSEVSDGQLARWLDETHALAAGFERLVAVIHTPPLCTRLDRVASGHSVGSRAVRDFLERVQPDVCICGHIHESVAEDRLGRTALINPGMLDHGGYVRLDFERGELSARLMRLGDGA